MEFGTETFSRKRFFPTSPKFAERLSRKIVPVFPAQFLWKESKTNMQIEPRDSQQSEASMRMRSSDSPNGGSNQSDDFVNQPNGRPNLLHVARS